MDVDASRITCTPISDDPTSVIILGIGLELRYFPIIDAFPVTRLKAPSGKPISYASLAMNMEASGVLVLGFNTHGQPEAIAGASLTPNRLRGLFHGRWPTTTPSGRR